MRHLVLSIASFLLFIPSANAANIVVQAKGTPLKRENCDIIVDFNSFASGIDQWTYNKITAHIQADTNIFSIRSYPVGDDGDVSLCLKLRIGKSSDTYQILRSMIPDEARAPTRIENNISGHSFTNAY